MRPLLRIAVSLGLLAVVATRVDLGDILDRLLGMSPGWIGLFLAVSVVQVVLSAWRWRYTAFRLGLDLPLGAATREYYLATLLNQLLPGGVVGDVSRAWRHARAGSGVEGEALRARAIHAVVIERASGQVVMLAVALASAAWLLGGAIWGGGVVAALIALGVAVARRGDGQVPGAIVADARPGVVASLRASLFSPRPFAVQTATSALVVSTYLGGFLLAGRAIEAAVPASALLPTVAPILVAMLIPLSVAGWGLREGGAALVFGLVGLPPEEGVAISVAYGVLVLVSALPGVVPLILDRRTRLAPATAPEDPDRREDPAPV